MVGGVESNQFTIPEEYQALGEKSFFFAVSRGGLSVLSSPVQAYKSQTVEHSAAKALAIVRDQPYKTLPAAMKNGTIIGGIIFPLGQIFGKFTQPYLEEEFGKDTPKFTIAKTLVNGTLGSVSEFLGTVKNEFKICTDNKVGSITDYMRMGPWVLGRNLGSLGPAYASLEYSNACKERGETLSAGERVVSSFIFGVAGGGLTSPFDINVVAAAKELPWRMPTLRFGAGRALEIGIKTVAAASCTICYEHLNAPVKDSQEKHDSNKGATLVPLPLPLPLPPYTAEAVFSSSLEGSEVFLTFNPCHLAQQEMVKQHSQTDTPNYSRQFPGSRVLETLTAPSIMARAR